MNAFFEYLIESIIAFVTLYALFRMLTRNLTYFNHIRLLAVAIVVFSAVVPLLHFSFESPTNVPVVFGVVLDTLTVKATNTQPTESDFSILPMIIASIYFLGVAFHIFRLIYQIIIIRRLIKSNIIKHEHQYKIVEVKNPINPFSFFNYIFYNPLTIENNSSIKIIIEHEKVHARELHSLDLLLVELFCIIQWFNPFAWLLKKNIQENHEYIVDREVLKLGIDYENYQNILVSQVITRQFAFANNLNKSLTFKRLETMKTPMSSNSKLRRLFYLLPVAAIVLFVFSCDKSESIIENMNTEKSTSEKKVEIVDKNKIPQTAEDGVFYIVEEMPEYPGGQDALKQFIAQNIKYPAICRDANIQGKTYVKCAVLADGSIGKISIVRSAAYNGNKNEIQVVGYASGNTTNDPTAEAYKELDNEAIRVISLLPKWKPGKQKGQAVDVYYTIPINFSLQ